MSEIPIEPATSISDTPKKKRRVRVAKKRLPSIIPEGIQWGRQDPEWPMLAVTWHDASSFGGGQNSKEVVRSKFCFRRSIGFLIYVDENVIYMAGDDDRDASSDDDCDNVTEIPLAMAKEIIRLVPK